MMTFGHRFVRRSDVRFPWLITDSAQRPIVRSKETLHPFDLRGRMGWKRAKDIAISLFGLIIFSPVMIAAAIAVKVTSPGPVFYRQERIGINRRRGDRRRIDFDIDHEQRRRDRRVLVNFGRPFTIYKFRTMVMDAERGAPPMWAKENDPRITGVGRVMRRSRIDELPQFLNVLRGDMSIVGPRPERAYFIGRIEKELPDFHLRLRAKPGITGLAQVRLGYTNTDEGLRQKLQMDLEYIHTLGIWTDIKILWRTIFVVLTGKGAC
ncbi:MAG TPA: sugar transferase [Candidatus Krumholzibacteria bacterium]|nr:sugar transferase [Candidatus Krumholzibacteria bacterium]